MAAHPTIPPRPRPTPLRAILLFTFLNSVGSAVVNAGLYFMAQNQYGFGRVENFALALLYGVAYIPAAVSVGPLLRRLAVRGVSPRSALLVIMVGMAGVCLLPWLAARMGWTGSWPLWVTVGVYSPLSGSLWPITESYLAGGRSEKQLRSAIGKFNITWSSSLVVTLLAISPLVERYTLGVLIGLACVHVLGACVLRAFAPLPAAHHHEHHQPAPLVYHQLLAFLRMMLPVSFMFVSTLSPYLPSALSKLKLGTSWEAAAAATWLFARMVTCATMERWHGWHGRWTTPVVGACFLAGSFAWVVIMPGLFEPGPGVWVLLAGLAGFGVGVGIIYASALYYAMEVGNAGVDAGGMHETLIGIGYTVGPLCGLAAAGAGRALGSTGVGGRSDVLMLGLVIVLGLGTAALAVSRAVRRPVAE